MNKLFFSLVLLGSLTGFSQSKIIGEVVYMNSNSTPAVGVHITAKGSNGAYSKSDGTFVLNFPSSSPGITVYPSIGGVRVIDGEKSEDIELVNEGEIRWINIPKNPNQEKLKIVVCPKGFRDEIAQKYYGIIKTESKRQLELKKEEVQELREKLGDYHDLVIQKQDELNAYYDLCDSLTLFKEAMRLASINKDDSSERVKKYLDALSANVSVEEARKELSTKRAYEEGEMGTDILEAAYQEIELDATTSANSFEYLNAIGKRDTLNLLYKDSEIILNKRILNLIELGRLSIERKDSPSGLAYFDEAFNLVKRNGNNKILTAQIQSSRAALRVISGKDYKLAQDELFQAISFFEEAKEESGDQRFNIEIAKAEYILCELFTVLLDHEKAELHCAKGLNNILNLAESCQEKLVLSARGYNLMGGIFFDKGNYRNAERYFLKALEYYTLMNGNDIYTDINPALAQIKSNLGNICYYQNDFDNALSYLDESDKIYQFLREQDITSFSYEYIAGLNCYGNIYRAKKDYLKSILAFNKALRIVKSKKNIISQIDMLLTATLYYNRGLLNYDFNMFYRSLADTEKAMSFYKLLAQNNSERYSGDVAKCYEDIGNAHRMIGVDFLYSDFNKTCDAFSKSEIAYNDCLEMYSILCKYNRLGTRQLMASVYLNYTLLKAYELELKTEKKTRSSITKKGRYLIRKGEAMSRSFDESDPFRKYYELCFDKFKPLFN